jgi:hypothetical protein
MSGDGEPPTFYARSKHLSLALELLRGYCTRSKLRLCDKERQTNVRGCNFLIGRPVSILSIVYWGDAVASNVGRGLTRLSKMCRPIVEA